MVPKKLTVDILEKEEAKRSWDKIVSAFPSCNLYQSYNWGEIKKEFGWLPIRSVAKGEDGEIYSASQVLVKKMFGILLAWVPGGPIYNSEYSNIGDGIHSLIHLKNGRNIFKYIRIYPMTHIKEYDSEWLVNEGWNRPGFVFHKSLTTIVDMEMNMESMRKRLTGKWRYYLKRSESFKHEIRRLKDGDEMDGFVKAHGEMCKEKDLKEEMSLKEIKIMNKFLEDDLFIIATCANSVFTSAWMIARFKDTAYVLRAFSTEEGKKKLASYFCLWQAIKLLKTTGCKKLEMGGIDPENNPGVTHFKRGIGGEEMKWLGEWEFSNNILLRKSVSFVLKNMV